MDSSLQRETLRRPPMFTRLSGETRLSGGSREAYKKMATRPHPVPHQLPSLLPSSPLFGLRPLSLTQGFLRIPRSLDPPLVQRFAHHVRLCLYTQVSHMTAERVIVLVEGRGGC